MIWGILLAGGASRRFGADKLLEPVADGTPMAVAAAAHLIEGVDAVVAVVRPGRPELAGRLRATGCRVVICPGSREGMGVSLAAGVRATPIDAAGWVVALGDMPWISPETVRQVARAIRDGALVAAPRYRGSRGHPVGFGARLRADLLRLQGDRGARDILRRERAHLVQIDCADPGVVKDVDTPADLAGGEDGE
ncbi:MAG TPA: nucleotidyltransferase family protein [Gammaproteobacteria bacterium]|nr:nucleotidyltransferase family protein [Gammaproteobacteria bacterium]